MKTSIIIYAPGISSSRLAEELYSIRFELPGTRIRKLESESGLSIDTGLVTLSLDLAKATLPALISALVTIWATRKKADKPPTIVIVTLNGEEKSVKADPREQLNFDSEEFPFSIEEIERIRLE